MKVSLTVDHTMNVWIFYNVSQFLIHIVSMSYPVKSCSWSLDSLENQIYRSFNKIQVMRGCHPLRLNYNKRRIEQIKINLNFFFVAVVAVASNSIEVRRYHFKTSDLKTLWTFESPKIHLEIIWKEEQI